LFGGNSDPRQTYDKQDLSERKIREPELFFEDRAARLDALFFTLEFP
jgi:hypothetical protein